MFLLPRRFKLDPKQSLGIQPVSYVIVRSEHTPSKLTKVAYLISECLSLSILLLRSKWQVYGAIILVMNSMNVFEISLHYTL